MKLAKAIPLLPLALAALAAASAIAPVENDGLLLARLEGFRFIEGKQLERLKSGQSVAYDFSLQVFEGPRGVGRGMERFVVSYDLWEESFAVRQLSPGPARQPAAGAAHLKLDMVGDWCLARLKVPAPAHLRGKDLTLQLEVRSVGGKLPNPLRTQGSVDLTTMVEIFSRPAAAGEYRFLSQSKSFRLSGGAAPGDRLP